MQEKINPPGIISWLFGIAVFTVGVLNMFLVHPVPGIIYLLLSFVYFPPAHTLFKRRWGISIPGVIKIILGIVIIWFTLGISDLAEMAGL